MELRRDLLHLDLGDRIQRDDATNRLFINFEKFRVRSKEDIDRIRAEVERLCEGQARRVDVIVNYDGFRIEEDVEQDYVAMVQDLEDRYYAAVTRYSGSAFTRMKLGRAFSRSKAPHIFETAEDAQAFLEAAGRRG
jgi:propionate CoA-transferase